MSFEYEYEYESETESEVDEHAAHERIIYMNSPAFVFSTEYQSIKNRKILDDETDSTKSYLYGYRMEEAVFRQWGGDYDPFSSCEGYDCDDCDPEESDEVFLIHDSLPIKDESEYAKKRVWRAYSHKKNLRQKLVKKQIRSQPKINKNTKNKKR